MARRPIVTRTITTTEVTMMCVNIVTQQVSNITVTLPREYKDNNAITRFIEKNDISFGENEKPVTIVSTNVVNSLYGMYEEDFVKQAHKLDDKRCIIDENGNTTIEEDTTEEVRAEQEEKPVNKKSKK